MCQEITISNLISQSLPGKWRRCSKFCIGCIFRIFKYFNSTFYFELRFQALYFTTVTLKIQTALKVAQTKAAKDLRVLESAFGNDRIICECSGMMSFSQVESGEIKLDHPLKICCWSLKYKFPSGKQNTIYTGLGFTSLGTRDQNLALKRFCCVIYKVMEIFPLFGWTGWPTEPQPFCYSVILWFQ